MKIEIKDDFIDCKYKLIDFLGEGSYGKVFLYEDKITKSKVAIKYIDFTRLHEGVKDKIIQEGQILFKITHKNITTFENFFYNKSRAILIMEYAEGGDLHNKIEEQKLIGPFKEKTIISWFLELCEAIKYLHQNHILHRDLKPLNIFFTKDNHIKVGDFGLSKVLNSTKDLTGTKSIGTYIYMSPEVLNKEVYYYSYSCDIWSLGIILFELCLLENPLIHLKEEEKIKEFILNGDFGNLIIQKNIRQNFSEKTCDLIKKILVQNPNERPTIDEIIQKCKDILFDNDINNQKFYTNNLFFIQTPQNEECEKNLEKAIKVISNEGLKIFNNVMKKENIDRNGKELNIKGKSNNYTPELVKDSTNRFKESNRAAPPVQLPHQMSVLNLVDNNMYNNKNYLKNKNSEENYFLFTDSKFYSKMKKSNRNNENNKGEGNNNDRVEKYEISNYCLLK